MEVINQLIKADYILADALVRCDDEALRKGLTKGWYISQIQQSLEKFSMQSFFDERPPLDLPIPKNMRWQLPDDLFNIQQLYAFNGSCCDVNSSANIYFKRNFNNAPNGKGYTAMNKADQQSPNDPYFWYYDYNTDNINGCNNQLFANIQNGYLMFSTACSGYTNFRVIYNGFGGSIGQAPLIPRPLREIITDLTVLKASEALMVKYPKSMYGNLYDRTNVKIWNKNNGTWWDAERFCKLSNGWINECRMIYTGNYGGW